MGPGKEVIGNRPQAVLIRRGGNELSGERLGSNVHQGPHEEPCSGESLLGRQSGLGGDPEIQKFYVFACWIVHDIVRLEIPVDDPSRVRRIDRIGDLAHNVRNFLTGERRVTLRVAFEQLTWCPFDGQKVKARARLTNLDRADHVRVKHPGTVGGFTQKPRDGCAIIAQLFPQDFDCNRTVPWMVGTVDYGGAALTDLLANGVTGERRSGEVLARHAGEANPPVETQQAAKVTFSMSSSTMFFGRLHVSSRHGRRRSLITVVSMSAVLGCGGSRQPPEPSSPERDQPASRGTPSSLLDPTELYQRNGMIARTTPMAFVGSIRFFPTSRADSTLVLLALSMPNRSLTFTVADDRQEASYVVITEARQAGAVIQRREARESVRVASFRETTRGDESVIFQQFMMLAPGSYEMAVIVRDAGSARSGAYEVTSSVPRFEPNTVAPPVVAYEATPRIDADSLPRLVINPRATIVFGRDTVVPIYVEQSSPTAPGSEATVSVLSSEGGLLWSDTVALQPGKAIASAVGSIPATRFGVGHFWITAAPLAGAAGAIRVPLFISFGDEWGIAPLEEMVSYLRYFVSHSRLQALRDAAPEARASAWMTFWRETDPDPQTTEHEGLRDYFRRLITANERFRDEGGPGWLTERGRVFITLGEPDQILEQGEVGIGNRGRLQIWQYLQHRAQFVFVDQSGFGRWRMTPASEAEFESIAVRVRRR